VLAAAAPAQQPAAPLPSPLVQPTVTTPATAARAAAADAPVKMEIFEGPNRTVRYFSPGSPGEQATLNDLERAENQMTYLKDVQRLMHQYVTSERTLEPMRRYVQEQLYGTSISTSNYNTATAVIPSGYGPGYGYSYPYAYPYNYGGYGYGYGGGLTAYAGGAMSSVTRNLGYGMGNEGCLKDDLSQVIAQQAASPDFQAAVVRNYNTALGQVSRNDRLASALGIKSGPIAEAGYTGAPVTLTLKNGDRLEGATMEEDGDWYVLDKGKPREERVRKSEVVRISKNSSVKR
jgi:hypothetical protein